MRQAIRISEQRSGERAVLRVAGRLMVGVRAERILRRVRRVLDRGARDLTLDLAAVRSIDCGGIGLLLLCRDAALGRGARLRVSGTAGPIRSMLVLSDLLDPLERGERADHPESAQRRRVGQDAPVLLSA